MRIPKSWRLGRRRPSEGSVRAARLVARADAARDAGQAAVAAVLYEESLRIEPRAGIHVQCGHMHKEAGDYAAAARHYARAEQLTPDDADLQLQIGHLHKLAGGFEAAKAAYGRAVVLAPDWPEPGRELAALVARSRGEIPDEAAEPPGRVPSAPGRDGFESVARWLRRDERLSRRTRDRLRARLDRFTEGCLLSLVMPVRDPRADWLRRMLDSVRAQWCGRWELICVDDGSAEPHGPEMLRDYAARDPRIRVAGSEGQCGIAAAINRGLRLARGGYVAFVDQDDCLEPDAVFKLLRAGRTGAELIYADELVTGEDLDRIEQVAARPAFSYDYYLSHPYFVHPVCVRRDVALATGGWDERLPVSADVDFVLRVIERASRVAHVASVLYRWRTHSDSAGHRARAQVEATTRGVIEAHLRRIGSEAIVRPGLGFNQFRVDFPDAGGATLVVIPTRDRLDLLEPCIRSIEATTPPDMVRIVVVDHESKDPATREYLRAIAGRHAVMPYRGAFNYSAMNNAAVRLHGEGCRQVLFANNDIEAIEPGWLESMRRYASRADVGCVGATLIYPDRTIQHAGVVVGIGGHADHAHRLHGLTTAGGERNPGYLQAMVSARDASAVTAACMMVPLAAFARAGGFDEALAVGFNDTDLCLRIGELGLKVLMDPYAVLLHRESATRSRSDQLAHPEDSRLFRRTWHALIERGDPFYNPMLALEGADHRLSLKGPGLARIGQVRVMPVVLPKSADGALEAA